MKKSQFHPTHLLRASAASAAENNATELSANNGEGCASCFVGAEYESLLQALSVLVHNLQVAPGRTDELIQVALIHFWEKLVEHPGQRRRWYLQSCRFYLQHRIRHDRTDRAFGQAQQVSDQEMENALGVDNSLFSTVAFRDTRRVLLAALHGRARFVFRYLALGLKVGDIAERLHCTHQNVTYYLSEIADVAGTLGIERYWT